MSYFYFDESIRENGKFIIGALVISESDLSPIVRNKWLDMGLNPDIDEYKSSIPKRDNPQSIEQRVFIGDLLSGSRLALVILPVEYRKELGNYCASLLFQLLDSGLIPKTEHKVYIDENIKMRLDNQKKLAKRNIQLYLNSNSALVAGIQLSDHAAHVLGGMLLEEMGLVNKRIRAGEDSGYHPDEMLNLGFELWASLRHTLIGKQIDIEDPASSYYLVEGYGLYIAPTCSDFLYISAKRRFSTNYLGCIH